MLGGTTRKQLGAALVGALSCVPCARPRAAEPFPVYAADACSSNPWLIPFDQGKAELSAFARRRLDALVAAWRIDAGPVLASGRVDGAEEGRDGGLAQRRLQAVSEALAARGVAAGAIWTRDDGGGHGFVENRPGIPEQQNRIVLITLARGGDHCARDLAKARAAWLVRNCTSPHPKATTAECDDAMSRLE